MVLMDVSTPFPYIHTLGPCKNGAVDPNMWSLTLDSESKADAFAYAIVFP